METGDRFYYLFICKYFENARKQFLHQYYYKWLSTHRFGQLMNNNKNKYPKKQAKFILLSPVFLNDQDIYRCKYSY